MCETLSELRDGLGRYAAGFEADLLSVADAEAVVVLACAIERIAALVKGLAAARVADVGLWKAAGSGRPPTTWLGWRGRPSRRPVR